MAWFGTRTYIGASWTVMASPDGSITWTDHSTSCSICTGIADLTVSELGKGTPAAQIREMVHTKFKYTGVWTDTPPIP